MDQQACNNRRTLFGLLQKLLTDFSQSALLRRLPRLKHDVAQATRLWPVLAGALFIRRLGLRLRAGA